MYQRIPLSARMEKIVSVLASNLPDEQIVADVGTDHGLIPIYLICNHLCRKVIASDINQGPLQAAEKNMAAYGIGKDAIELRHGPGFSVITPGECHTLLVAGMGGMQMCSLMEADPLVAQSAASIVFQPMNGQMELRRFLYSSGYELVDEVACVDGDRVYTVIRCRYEGKNAGRTLNFTPEENALFHLGPFLPIKTDEGSISYLKKLRTKSVKIIKGMEQSESPDDKKQLEYTLLLDRLNEILKGK